jgi:hypothetical protein
MTCTTFSNAVSIVHSSSRTPDFLRTAERNVTIGECKIANRSNYTRVTFEGDRGAAFVIPVGPYSVRVYASAVSSSTANILGIGDDKVSMALNAAEMRAIAYGFLAAANHIDSRDSGAAQSKRKPGAKYQVLSLPGA